MARPQRNHLKAEPAKGLIRPVRPEKKNVEGPIGGWMKNVPTDCRYKQVDTDGYWTEVAICSFICKANTNCPAYEKLKAESKTRIKLMNTNPLPKTCPYCSCGIQVKTDIETVYICQTSGNRLTQEFEKKCGKSNARRRR